MYATASIISVHENDKSKLFGMHMVCCMNGVKLSPIRIVSRRHTTNSTSSVLELRWVVFISHQTRAPDSLVYDTPILVMLFAIIPVLFSRRPNK